MERGTRLTFGAIMHSGLGNTLGNLFRLSNAETRSIQALGWRSGRRYLPLQDDLASVAFWYQSLPSNPHPPLPDRDQLEVN